MTKSCGRLLLMSADLDVSRKKNLVTNEPQQLRNTDMANLISQNRRLHFWHSAQPTIAEEKLPAISARAEHNRAIFHNLRAEIPPNLATSTASFRD